MDGNLGEILGFVFGVLLLVALGDASPFLSRQAGFSFIPMGRVAIIPAPVFGLLIIITTRFLAEQIRALVAVANNTKSFRGK